MVFLEGFKIIASALVVDLVRNDLSRVRDIAKYGMHTQAEMRSFKAQATEFFLNFGWSVSC